ncbi:hypothetical protein KCP77_01155 [Salmonella enterica subsp. enterica]|nr:hypothetical protein KCP77_01155 [Salmonella enterica subsp. enterica]
MVLNPARHALRQRGVTGHHNHIHHNRGGDVPRMASTAPQSCGCFSRHENCENRAARKTMLLGLVRFYQNIARLKSRIPVTRPGESMQTICLWRAIADVPSQIRCRASPFQNFKSEDAVKRAAPGPTPTSTILCVSPASVWSGDRSRCATIFMAG